MSNLFVFAHAPLRLHRQVAREVRANLAPDALVLSVIVGLTRQRQAQLLGINGSTGEYQVRWVDVAPTTVNSFDKQGYSRMDIRKVRK